MNSRQLQYVIAVANEKSFSEAAKKLIISQPSLSQYIQKLENELGTALFVRTSPLKLTYEGEIYVSTAKRILAEEDYAQKFITDIVNEKVGRIVIGASPINSMCILPVVISEFQKQYPNVKVSINEHIEPELFGQLNNDECDIILTTLKNDDYSLQNVYIGSEDFLLAIPKCLDENIDYKVEYSSDNKRILPIIDILKCKNIPFIILRNKKIPLHIALDRICKEAGFLPTKAIECTGVLTALSLVSAGVGACYVPSSTLMLFNSENVHYYLLKQNPIRRKLSIIYKKDKYLSKAAKKLIEIVVKMYENQSLSYI